MALVADRESRLIVRTKRSLMYNLLNLVLFSMF